MDKKILISLSIFSLIQFCSSQKEINKASMSDSQTIMQNNSDFELYSKMEKILPQLQETLNSVASISRKVDGLENFSKKLEKKFQEISSKIKNNSEKNDELITEKTENSSNLKVENLEIILIIFSSILVIFIVIFVIFVVYVMKKFKFISKNPTTIHNPGYDGRSNPLRILQMSKTVATSNATENCENIYEDPSALQNPPAENVYDDIVYSQNNRGQEIVRINGKEYLRFNGSEFDKSQAIKKEYDKLNHFES